MDTEIDWARELDGSFGAGPDVPVGHYVDEGRRAVRRRRAVFSSAGVAVVVGLAWTLAPGATPRSSEAPIAADPSATASPTPSESPSSDAAPFTLAWRKDDPPARSGPAGLQIREGAVVHERRDELYPGKDTESVALDISYRGERWWMRLEWDDGGSAMSSTRPEDGLFDTFEAFVAAEIAGGGMTREPVLEDDERFPYGGLVDWSAGDLEVKPGVVVLQQVEDPVGSTDPSLGLALRFRGEVTWMLITTDGSGSAASYEKAAESGWTTFGQWLSEHVALQAGEPGLRLVSLDDDSSLTPAEPGAQIVDQQADPDLPAYGTDQASASAVALVTWHGERWFVLAVRLPDQDSVTTFAVEKTGGAQSLDDFIAFAVSRAGEGGLR